MGLAVGFGVGVGVDAGTGVAVGAGVGVGVGVVFFVGAAGELTIAARKKPTVTIKIPDSWRVAFIGKSFTGRDWLFRVSGGDPRSRRPLLSS